MCKKTENLCYVLDIGTTTLVMALVSLEDKKAIKVLSELNPQRMYGADVMARIEHCMRNGAQRLQSVLVKKINEMVQQFALPEKLDLYVAGNTTMLHLLKGVDCSAMGVAPYKAVFLDAQEVNGTELGLCKVGKVMLLPSIAAFVGADLVAGLYYVGMPEDERYRLLIDLGTNAEIVFFGKEQVLCTSAAAGPCFEGANISCGMSATRGAIYAYSDEGVRTIGDAPAQGICGTGLVDVIAEFLRKGWIDDTGYMAQYDGRVTEQVFLTQRDIRQFQNAKSAICAAICTVMEAYQISADRIEGVYVAGGFSTGLSVANAVALGLIPERLGEKCKAIDNSSLLGTMCYACEKGDLSGYLKNATYVDLAMNERFSELFIENLYLRRRL